MTAPLPTKPVQEKWIVKQVNSGDSVILQGKPRGGPPPEKSFIFSNITAPKLGKRSKKENEVEETQDEPWAWEAREYLRKKLIGEEVIVEVSKHEAYRDYGVIYLAKEPGKEPENITKSLVSEGLVSVRREARPPPEELIACEDAAKAAGKGKWSQDDPQNHVRNVKYITENVQSFLDKNSKHPFQAIIEHVRDGHTVRATLLPDFYVIPLMISGVKCHPTRTEPATAIAGDFGEEAKFFVERRLLNRDVEIILESSNNNYLVGSIRHPKGNIAEALLREGFAQCVDWSIAVLKSGADKLRAAEKYAKENRLRRWKNYQPPTSQLTGKEKEYTATVVEVVGGDALMVKKVGQETVTKIFLSSLRPPRDAPKIDAVEEKAPPGQRSKQGSRQLYDVPWMFEAREFLRKKLIGKKVQVVVDYIQPQRDSLPAKSCCTVTISGVNVAEAMISKGLGTVVHYRQDDDQRSSHYDELNAAEVKAKKSLKGVHSNKKDIPVHRVTDASADVTRAKQFFNGLKRSGRTEALVEFVASGSRLRLYIPKDSYLITFLLAGVSCPRAPRRVLDNNAPDEGEPFGEEALQFTKEKCQQREVEISVDSVDRGGNFIGWLWVDGLSLNEALVDNALAKVHFSAEKTEYYKLLKSAEDRAKARREKIWKDYVEEEKEEKVEEEVVTERKVDYQNVVVIEGTKDLKFYAQLVDQGPKLETLMSNIRQEFQSNPPLQGAFTPHRGDLCAAKFTEDDEWYRARVEKVQGSQVHVYFVDYGNREVTTSTRCAALPSAFTAERPFAHEYTLAFVQLPNDNEYQLEAIKAFKEDIENRTFLLNVEYRVEKSLFVTLVDPKTKEDVGQNLVKDGLLLADKSRQRRNPKQYAEYIAAQDEAKKAHRMIWEYGDITEDDAKEFGR